VKNLITVRDGTCSNLGDIGKGDWKRAAECVLKRTVRAEAAGKLLSEGSAQGGDLERRRRSRVYRKDSPFGMNGSLLHLEGILQEPSAGRSTSHGGIGTFGSLEGEKRVKGRGGSGVGLRNQLLFRKSLEEPSRKERPVRVELEVYGRGVSLGKKINLSWEEDRDGSIITRDMSKRLPSGIY